MENEFSNCECRNKEERRTRSIRQSRKSPIITKSKEEKLRDSLLKLAEYAAEDETTADKERRAAENEDEDTAVEQLDTEGVYRDVQAKETAAANIHRPEFRKYWLEVLNPDKYVKAIIEERYKLPFEGDKMPGKYEEPNNKSAQQDMPYVRKAVEEMIRKRSVKKLKEKPHCVNPLIVSTRELSVNECCVPMWEQLCSCRSCVSRALY